MTTTRLESLSLSLARFGQTTIIHSTSAADINLYTHSSLSLVYTLECLQHNFHRESRDGWVKNKRELWQQSKLGHLFSAAHHMYSIFSLNWWAFITMRNLDEVEVREFHVDSHQTSWLLLAVVRIVISIIPRWLLCNFRWTWWWWFDGSSEQSRERGTVQWSWTVCTADYTMMLGGLRARSRLTRWGGSRAVLKATVHLCRVWWDLIGDIRALFSHTERVKSSKQATKHDG